MVAAYGYIQVSLHTQSSRRILYTLHTQLPLHSHAYKEMNLYAAVCSENEGHIERIVSFPSSRQPEEMNLYAAVKYAVRMKVTSSAALRLD